jgi:transcriptional regulator with XRE-family HTH domain
MSLSPIRERLRRRIIATMRRQNLSQMDLARIAGLKQGHVSEMVSGKRAFPIDRVDDIADALHVAPYVLFLDDPEQWFGRRDRRHGQRRSGADRRRTPSG